MKRSTLIVLIAVAALLTCCAPSASPPTSTPDIASTSNPNPTLTPTPDSSLADRQEQVLDALAQIRQVVDASVVPSDREDIVVLSITYLSDGLEVKGYLVIPAGGGTYPCVIFNHGGNRELGTITDQQAVQSLGNYASWGYVVVASQYRGNAGGEGQEEFGGADVNDVLSLIPLLEALPWADAARIGMIGWSRGGMMTYLVLTRTNRISAAIVGAGIVDLEASLEQRPAMESGVYAELIPNYAENREQALQARSAIHWPERLFKSTPILLLHGSADWRVHPSQALRMAQVLFDSEHPFRFVLFEGGDHGLSNFQEEVDQLMRDWLDRYVRDQEPPPSLELQEP